MSNGIFAILFFLATAQQQVPVKVYYENSPEGAVVLVDNTGHCPYTLDLSMDLKNMESDSGEHILKVIPPGTIKRQLATIRIKEKTSNSGFNFRTAIYLGNAIGKPITDHVYQLPFRKGETYVMSQGYNGNFSHQGKNSLDFTMPEGTMICAARDGVVIEIRDDSGRGCPNRRCLDDANRIVIYHEDGTFSEYAHLQKRGSKVRPGDRIKTGDVIGISGNTGFTSGPHLHFEVYYYDKADKITITTPFQINDKSEFLQEKVFYKAE